MSKIFTICSFTEKVCRSPSRQHIIFHWSTNLSLLLEHHSRPSSPGIPRLWDFTGQSNFKINIWGTARGSSIFTFVKYQLLHKRRHFNDFLAEDILKLTVRETLACPFSHFSEVWKEHHHSQPHSYSGLWNHCYGPTLGTNWWLCPGRPAGSDGESWPYPWYPGRCPWAWRGVLRNWFIPEPALTQPTHPGPIIMGPALL